MKHRLNTLKITGLLIAGMFFLITFFSCQKIEKVSPIPEITFKSFTVTDAYDTLGITRLNWANWSFHLLTGMTI